MKTDHTITAMDVGEMGITREVLASSFDMKIIKQLIFSYDHISGNKNYIVEVKENGEKKIGTFHNFLDAVIKYNSNETV